MRLGRSCVVTALALALSACGSASSTKPITSGVAASVGTDDANSDNPKITLENAKKIRQGMTLQEVKVILGEEPKSEKSASKEKEKYSWRGAGKKSIFVTIQNEKITDLVSFSDPFAGPWDNPKVTKENAAKIKRGMTLPEVKAILGDPRSVIVLLDPAKGTTRDETYSWLNRYPIMSSATIGFRNGQVCTLSNYVGP